MNATGISFRPLDKDSNNSINTHNVQFKHFISDPLWYNEGSKESLKTTFMQQNELLSQPNTPQLSIPRHDSVLISAFEVEHIRQIQNFLLFPILNPLSEKPQPTPEIWQV